jgi:hypothetical protein
MCVEVPWNVARCPDDPSGLIFPVKSRINLSNRPLIHNDLYNEDQTRIAHENPSLFAWTGFFNLKPEGLGKTGALFSSSVCSRIVTTTSHCVNPRKNCLHPDRPRDFGKNPTQAWPERPRSGTTSFQSTLSAAGRDARIDPVLALRALELLGFPAVARKKPHFRPAFGTFPGRCPRHREQPGHHNQNNADDPENPHEPGFLSLESSRTTIRSARPHLVSADSMRVRSEKWSSEILPDKRRSSTPSIDVDSFVRWV